MEFGRTYLGCAFFWLILQGIESQTFMIKNVPLEKCIHSAHDTGRVSLAACKLHALHQHWIWDPETGSIVNAKSMECLTALKTSSDFSTLKMKPCDRSDHQSWTCDNAGHLTLRGHELYLTAKQGTKKVFVSKERDKFGRWRTLMDSPICKEVIEPTEIYETTAKQELEEVTGPIRETKLTTEETKTVSGVPFIGRNVSTTHGPGPVCTKDNGDLDQQFVGAEGNSIEMEKYERVQSGRGWMIAMLILSPLALMLGALILAMSVRFNKKRKLLSALPSRPRSIIKLGSSYEQCPLTEKGEEAARTASEPHSPSLRHGEILIEWKDGTVTPLFDPPQN
ncbi:uncharacterized protein LOC128467111 [Spea bombifrons]|uniref:uncharacterized protein LOC128467111 n=1 Tax=Spea bombifrons TaxID=233779 RepID=UPI00234A4F0B|nr:uncharacterized protein LOC128467111 [Spea bombifrons]